MTYQRPRRWILTGAGDALDGLMGANANGFPVGAEGPNPQGIHRRRPLAAEGRPNLPYRARVYKGSVKQIQPFELDD